VFLLPWEDFEIFFMPVFSMLTLCLGIYVEGMEVLIWELKSSGVEN
jgi:hypothetical protein